MTFNVRPTEYKEYDKKLTLFHFTTFTENSDFSHQNWVEIEDCDFLSFSLSVDSKGDNLSSVN